ncbi:MAG: hypothetical protein AAFV78_19100, partial [Bacteroidota bacterium]
MPWRVQDLDGDVPQLEDLLIFCYDRIEFGDVTIMVLHTPGHTMESTTYLLLDENGMEHAIF